MEKSKSLKQSKRLSLIESLCNQVAGILISLMTWVFLIIPVWGLEMTWIDNLNITGIFFIASLTRSYFIRRVFNRF